MIDFACLIYSALPIIWIMIGRWFLNNRKGFNWQNNRIVYIGLSSLLITAVNILIVGPFWLIGFIFAGAYLFYPSEGNDTPLIDLIFVILFDFYPFITSISIFFTWYFLLREKMGWAIIFMLLPVPMFLFVVSAFVFPSFSF